METTQFGTTSDGTDGGGRQSPAFAVLDASIRATWAQIDGLVQAHAVAEPEAREVIMTHLQAAFRDLEALMVLGELLGA